MAVFVELTTDAFEDNLVRIREKYEPGERAGSTSVRRPLRGLEIKEDTYGMIKVIQATGKELFLVDSGKSSGRGKKTSNFIMQTVQEARMEKHQIVETFGEPYIFFFGESPRFIDVKATLVNSFDFNWRAEWWANWELRIRGTKSVELGARTYLFYDDNIIEGYMLMAQAVEISAEPFRVDMQFRMFVTNNKNVTFVGDPNYPTRASVFLPPGIHLTDNDAFTKLIESFQTTSREQQRLQEFDRDNALQAARPFGGFRTLSNALRITSRSFAFPSSVQQVIDKMKRDNVQDNLFLDAASRTKPLREKIAANTDEWTGSSNVADQFEGQLPEVFNPRFRTPQEARDIWLATIQFMACFGADVNSYQVLQGLGMGASFGAGVGIGVGAGAGIGAGVGAGATFGASARAGVGFGGSAGAGFGFGAGGGTGFTSGAFAGAGTYGSSGSRAGFSANGFAGADSSGGSFFRSSSRSNADAFFGGGFRAQASASAGLGGAQASASSGISRDFGDPGYGYRSPFGGPGFGGSGYGDYGGKGYGSGFGSGGDPGYIQPENFRFKRVAENRPAYNRFATPRAGFGSGFGGVGAGDSYAGAGAGAVVSVGGAVSAFSMVSVGGTLDPTGSSLAGAGVNPFGVNCLDPTFAAANLASFL